MAERSRPWSGTVTGDAGPYTDDQWTDVWKAWSPSIASHGVFRAQLNDLDLSGVAATPVDINTGRALVNGIWYENDASVAIAVPDAVANARVDRIVLRADWALQTVRLTRIAGVEAAAPVPTALTQVDGVTWDLPLWQVFVAVGPASVLTFYRDERSFIGQYEPGEPTDEYVYLEDELYLPAATIAASENLGTWGIEIAGNYDVTAMPAFGSGAVRLNNTGAGLGHVAFFCRQHRPELINAHTIMRAKNPNTDANLDRTLGYVALLADPTPVGGVFFRSVGAANWEAVCRSAGVETAVGTGQAVDNTWRKFETRQNGLNVVTFLIDDAVVATIQTNIPGVDCALAFQIVDSGVTPVVQAYMEVDRVRVAGDRV